MNPNCPVGPPARGAIAAALLGKILATVARRGVRYYRGMIATHYDYYLCYGRVIAQARD
jgi:hypothetical protein